MPHNTGGYNLLTDIEIFLFLCFQLISTLLAANILNTFSARPSTFYYYISIFDITVCNIFQFLVYDVPILLCIDEDLKCCLSNEFH